MDAWAQKAVRYNPDQEDLHSTIRATFIFVEFVLWAGERHWNCDAVQWGVLKDACWQTREVGIYD